LSYAPFWGMAIGLEYFGGGSQRPTIHCILTRSPEQASNYFRQTSIVAISTVERCPSTTAIPLSVT